MPFVLLFSMIGINITECSLLHCSLNDGLSKTLESICQENEARRYHLVDADFKDPEVLGEVSKNLNGEAVKQRQFFEDKLLFDETIGKAELLDDSLFWTNELLLKFCKYLPPSLQRCDWKLVYSTAVHGISINTLYRNSKKHGGPCVLSILDDKGYVSTARKSRFLFFFLKMSEGHLD